MVDRVIHIPEMRGGEFFPPYPDERKPIKALPFTAFDDIDPEVRKEWIIKGVLARGETSSWIGPPKSGKSALLTDIVVASASGGDWRGYRSKARCAVVYFAFERGDLLKRRLDAYRRRYCLDQLAIAVVTAPVDLMASGCIDIIAATFKAVEDRFSMSVGLMVINTFSKAMAFGGGDEDKALSQNRVLGHLREVQNKTGVHVALVGHTGKIEERGARGSNAHLGDVDVMIQISGDKVKEVIVTLANDQPDGRLTTFTLETFEFGEDEDGDPVTTAIIAQEIPIGQATAAKATPVTPQQRNSLDALDEAIGAFGRDVSAEFQLPKGSKAVTFEQWKQELIRRSVLDADDEHIPQTFYKLRMALIAKKEIAVRDQMAWRAR